MLYLVRHGETRENATGVVQLPDAALSARGEEQARQLALRLAGAGLRTILSSDLPRAARTARALAAAAGARVVPEPLLQERNFGELRGRAYAEIEVDPFAPDYVPVGGESLPEFHRRVARAWERIQRAAAAGPLAVVTHGFVCHALVTRHLELAEGVELPVRAAGWGNASLTIAEPPTGSRPWRVRLLGCRAHLAEVETPDSTPT